MKKIFSLLFIISITLSLSGCWSSKQPKDLAIINSALYDIDDENNYLVTIQITNPSAIGTSNSGGNSSIAGITVSGKGQSISDAFVQTSSTVDRELFGEHNKVRFFTENFASKDYAVINFLDFMLRDNLTDATSMILIVSDEDKDKIYNATTLGLSNIVGNYLGELITKQKYISSKGVNMKSLDFVKLGYKEGQQQVAGVVKLVESTNIPSLNNGLDPDEIKYEFVFEGLAVFKDYSLVGFMDASATEIYNIIVNDAYNIDMKMMRGVDYASVHLVKPKADIKASFDGEKAIIDIDITGNMYLNKMYIYGVNNDNFNDTLKKLEQDLSAQLMESAIKAIKEAQDYESDIYGFGAQLHYTSPEIWSDISSEWDNYFKNAEINVKCDLTITREGEINRSYFN
jgi:spore germination protein KC